MKVRAKNLLYRDSAEAVVNTILTSDAHKNETPSRASQSSDTRNSENSDNQINEQNATSTESMSAHYKLESTINIGLSESLFSLWQDQKMCDLTICADCTEFKAHKLVLAARSDRYSSSYWEKLPPSFYKINLTDSSAEAVEDILRFIYTSELALDSHNIDHVTGCAKQLGITSALKLCKNYLLKNYFHSIFTMRCIAEKHGIMDVLSRLEVFICENFSEVYNSSGFLNATFEQIWYFICKENLPVKRELDIFLAISAWIDYNPTERLRYAAEMMSRVCFDKICPDDLSTMIETADHIFRIKECREMLLGALRHHAVHKSGSRQPVDSKHRTCAVYNFEHAMGDRKQVTRLPSDVQKSYLTEITSQTRRSKIPGLTVSQNAKRYHAEPSNVTHKEGKYLPSFNEYPFKRIDDESDLSDAPSIPLPQRPATMIAVGGVDPFYKLPYRLVEMYNPSTDSWSSLTYLPEPRNHFAVAVLDGCLYVIGGSILNKGDADDLGKPTDICFRYDPLASSWSRIAPLRQPRMYLSVCVLEGVLYALGGKGANRRSLDTVEYYNPYYDAWMFAAPMFKKKLGTAAAGYKGLLFVAGGFLQHSNRQTTLDSVECYDPRTNSWFKRNPLPIACCHANLVKAKGNLYLLGGSTLTGQSTTTSNSLSTVFRYLETDDCWVHLQNMRISRHGAGVTAIDSRIYIVGGVSHEEKRGLHEMECLDVNFMTWIDGLAALGYPVLDVVCCSFEDEIAY